MIDPNLLHAEILDGLKNERDLLDERRESIEIYQQIFDRYRYDYEDPDGRSRRDIPLMTRIIDSLAQTYKRPPTRTIVDQPEADEWLSAIYRHSKVNAIMQAADAYSHAADLFAIEVQGTEDPLHPIRLQCWTGDSIVAWTEPDDPCRPAAVCTIDVQDGRRRYRLWTPTEVRTYLTMRWSSEVTTGGTAPVLVDVQPNTYGTIPFAFVHYQMPVVQWCTRGPGSILATANEHVNYRLRRNADAIRYLSRPLMVFEGVDATFELPRITRPGEGVRLPATRVDSRGDLIKPEIKFPTAPLDWVDKEWADLNQWLDLLLQSIGVPPAAIRMVQTSAKSGVAIVAEQLPLMLRAMARQELYSCFEADLAKKILEVAVAHLSTNNVPVAALNAALADFNLSVRWDNSDIERLLHPDMDEQDEWALSKGLKSKTMILMQREGLTRDEAQSRLEEIAKDLKYEESLVEEEKDEEKMGFRHGGGKI